MTRMQRLLACGFLVLIALVYANQSSVFVLLALLMWLMPAVLVSQRRLVYEIKTAPAEVLDAWRVAATAIDADPANTSSAVATYKQSVEGLSPISRKLTRTLPRLLRLKATRRRMRLTKWGLGSDPAEMAMSTLEAFSRAGIFTTAILALSLSAAFFLHESPPTQGHVIAGLVVGIPGLALGYLAGGVSRGNRRLWTLSQLIVSALVLGALLDQKTSPPAWLWLVVAFAVSGPLAASVAAIYTMERS